MNENLVRNAANVFKIYYWIVAFFYWLYVIIGLIALTGFCVDEGKPLFALLALPLLPVVLLLFFLLRISMKLPIELLIYCIESRKILNEIRNQQEQKQQQD